MRTLLIIPFVSIGLSLFGQNAIIPDSTSVSSIDGIVNEVLRVLSGTKDQERPWDWFRHLFTEQAQVTMIKHIENDNEIEIISIDSFLERMAPGLAAFDFLEYETGKVVDEYNGLAQVFQSYVVKQGPVEERGINSYQLVYSQNRWWISALAWSSNNNGQDIPEAYLNLNH